MPLKSLINESGVRPTNPTVNALYTSLLRFIATQESNNDYLEGLTLASGLSTSDANKALVVDPTGSGTNLVAVDQRTRIRLQDVLSVSGNTSGSDGTVTTTLGATGAGTLRTVGKVGSATAATAVLTQLGTASVAATATFTFGDTEFDDQADATITLIDAATTSKTYTIKASGASASSQQFNVGTTASATATNFAALVNSANGHNGTITATANGSQVLLTQASVGTAGNTSITKSNWDTICDVNAPSAFSGGTSIGTSLHGKTLILTDAAGTSHTLTYSTSAATSSSVIGVPTATVTTAAQVATQVKNAVNLANPGSIAMTATVSADKVTLTMTGTGTGGNGDKVSGTADSDSLVVATPFAGGSAGPQFAVIAKGNTGTDAGLTVENADTVSLTATNISLTGNTGLTLNKATIASLTYPITDGSANHVLKTDGSGNLSFADMRQFTSAATGASNTVYLNSYLPNSGGQLALDVEASSSTAAQVRPGYAFNGKLTSGFGAQTDTTSKAHNLFLKYNNDFAMRLTSTSSGDVLHLGNDATEFNAGTFVYVKPSFKGTNSFPSANADRQGSIFYDPANSKMHFYTSAAVKEIATVDAISGKLATAGGTVTGQIVLNSSGFGVSTTTMDLKFTNANNSGFYSKTSVAGGSAKALGFSYGGTGVFEFNENGIQGSNSSNAYTPFVKYANGSLESAPAYTFTDDTDTGMYRSAANTLSFTAGGTRRASVSSSGWDFNSQVLYNLPTPAAASHPATKGYVDGLISAGSTANALLTYQTDKWAQQVGITAPNAGGNQWLEIGVHNSLTGRLVLNSASNGFATTLQPGAIGSDLTLTLPTADGAANTIMTTNGSGQLGFSTLASLGDSRYVQPSTGTFTAAIQTVNGTTAIPAIKLGSGTLGLYRNTGQAYASFQFGDTEFDDHADETITIIDSAAVSKTYKIKASGASASSQEFNRGTSASTAATNLAALINGANGHNGSIVAEANVYSPGDVQLTQATGGTAGNTAIVHTSNWDAICDVNPPAAFVGGDNDQSIVYQETEYKQLAVYKRSNCAGVVKPAVQGTRLESGKLITENRVDGGPVHTFEGAEDTGIGYSGLAPVAATATFTFGVSSFDDHDDETITLIDVAGASRTYKIKKDNDASADTTLREFNVGANATAAATNFCAIVNDTNGHNGSIIATSVAGAVTLTQAVAGTGGNTAIVHTSNWDAICDVNPPAAFTGGTAGTSVLNLCADNSSTPVMAIKATDVTLNSVKIKGLATPTTSTDAATKGYVDASNTALIVPSAAGTAAGQIMTHNTGTGKPVFNSDLVYNSNELQIGNTGGSGTSSSLKMSTKYQFIEIAAPLASAASGTGSIAAYTLTLPTAVGNTKDVMVASNSSGQLKFERRGGYTVQCTYTVSVSSLPAHHDFRHDMELTLGPNPALLVTTGKTAPGGFTSSVSASGNTNVKVGSSATLFGQQPSFTIWVNGIEQSKGTNVIYITNSKIRLRTRLKPGDIITVQGMETADYTNMGF